MKIMFDMLAVNKCRHHGIGNYMENFCEMLMHLYPEYSYVFLNWSKQPFAREIWGENYQYEEVCIGEFCWKDEDLAYQALQNVLAIYNPNVYIDFSPLWGERPRLKKSWFRDTMLTGILHDVLPYALRKEYYQNKRNDFQNYIESMANLFEFDRLFANSEYTKADVVQYVGVDEKKITPIFCSYGRATDEPDKGNIREKAHTTAKEGQPYWLFPSGDAPQKNVDRLLMAYLDALQERPMLPKLLITGHFLPRKMSRYERLITENGADEKIRFTDYVTDEALIDLIENCDWILYPSLYEGFGMPIAESWHYGKPVLTSDCTATKEIAGESAVLVAPYDRKSISDGLIKICDMPEIDRLTYIAKGKGRMRKYSWKNTVTLFVNEIIDADIVSDFVGDCEERKAAFIQNKMEQYDEEFETIVLSENTDEELAKNIAYFHTLNLWMKLWEKNRSLSEYLLKVGFKKIAIYGMGILANHLIYEADKGGIQIVYGIDRDANQILDRIPVLSYTDELPEADAIIVTPVYAFDMIKNNLRGKVQYPILSIKQLLNEAFKG